MGIRALRTQMAKMDVDLTQDQIKKKIESRREHDAALKQRLQERREMLKEHLLSSNLADIVERKKRPAAPPPRPQPTVISQDVTEVPDEVTFTAFMKNWWTVLQWWEDHGDEAVPQLMRWSVKLLGFARDCC